MTRAAPIEADGGLQCSTPGCARRWTADFGRRLCRPCADGRLPPKQAPQFDLRDPVSPFNERAEREGDAA